MAVRVSGTKREGKRAFFFLPSPPCHCQPTHGRTASSSCFSLKGSCSVPHFSISSLPRTMYCRYLVRTLQCRYARIRRSRYTTYVCTRSVACLSLSIHFAPSCISQLTGTLHVASENHRRSRKKGEDREKGKGRTSEARATFPSSFSLSFSSRIQLNNAPFSLLLLRAKGPLALTP